MWLRWKMLSSNKISFNLKEFTKDKFKQKMLCLKNGKDKEAFIYANESIKFVRKNFSISEGIKRIELVDIYYHAQLILNELGKKQGCFKCLNKNYNAAFITFSTLHNCRGEDVLFRKKCGEYLKLTYESMTKFYLAHSKHYENSVLKEKFKKSYRSLLLL